MTKHLQPVRFSVFTLLDSLLKRFREGSNISGEKLIIALISLGKEFIEGFINLMANEKDPHNLMLSFSILKVIVIEFDIVGSQEVAPHSSKLIKEII